MPADRMANAFNMLRANDLIWGYMVSNYMLGKDPFPFDLLYWNADSTAMPARAHRYYLEEFYIRDAFAKGELVVGRHADHPRRHQGSGLSRGHQGGPHRPGGVGLSRRQADDQGRRALRALRIGPHRRRGQPPGAAEIPVLDQQRHVPGDDRGLADEAVEIPGSWWPDWDAWLKERSGKLVPAQGPGAKLGAIEPAPGSYVKVRFDAPA